MTVFVVVMVTLVFVAAACVGIWLAGLALFREVENRMDLRAERQKAAARADAETLRERLYEVERELSQARVENNILKAAQQ